MKNSDKENTKLRSNLPHQAGLFDPFEEAQCRKSLLRTANKRFLTTLAINRNPNETHEPELLTSQTPGMLHERIE